MKTIIAFLHASLLAVILTMGWTSVSQAQDAPLKIVIHPGQSGAEVQNILDLATRSNRAVTVEIGTAAAGAVPSVIPASAPVDNRPDAAPVQAAQPISSSPLAAPHPASAAGAQAPTPVAATISPVPMMPTPEMMATDMGMAKWSQFSAAFLRGASTALSSLDDISPAVGMADDRLIAEGSGYSQALAVTLASIGAAAAVMFLLRGIVSALSARQGPSPTGVKSTFNLGLRRLIGDIVSIVVFLVVARFAIGIIGATGDLTLQVAHGVVTAVIVAAIYVTLARVLFKTDEKGRSLVPIRRPQWHFRMLVFYGLISASLTEAARLADSLGVDRLIIDGWFLNGNTLLTVLKLVWFIGGRSEIRDAFIGQNPGMVRRVAGNLLPDFYIVTALGLWLICVLFAGTPNSARWVFAAGSTQIALLALPILALGAHALIDELTRYQESIHGVGLGSSLLASLRVLCAGAVWIGGLHLIATIWWPFLGGEAALATSWVMWVEQLSLAVVVSWAVASFIWRYSEAFAPSPAVMLPGHEDQNEKRQTSRLSTAMPVVRNLALGAVLTVGALIVLGSLGINVAPLLAGFGVLGLALSFGSQALVKDVVSGIFFIAEDAFRIGEYISTGNLQGTVEQIAIRSVRLRHHNGPVHTVPFGQISSVSNFSRDWGTIKFQLKFERDSDPELIRKTAKKVGLAMLEDPEYGADFLVPLKMQGIQDINENSIVVRFKFTSLPGNPSIIKREAMKRLIAACKAAGLEFASNAVTVRSRGDGMPDDMAAASHVMPLAPVASA